jgi:hypothetical protein
VEIIAVALVILRRPNQEKYDNFENPKVDVKLPLKPVFEKIVQI